MNNYYWTAYNKDTGEIKFFDTMESRDKFVSLSPETWEWACTVVMATAN